MANVSLVMGMSCEFITNSNGVEIPYNVVQWSVVTIHTCKEREYKKVVTIDCFKEFFKVIWDTCKCATYE